jgi:hypothetical protein
MGTSRRTVYFALTNNDLAERLSRKTNAVESSLASQESRAGTWLPGIALDRQRWMHSKAVPAQRRAILKCPKRTIWKVCRIKAASTAVRRACRNLNANRRTVLIRAWCATRDSRRKIQPPHGNGPTESSRFDRAVSPSRRHLRSAIQTAPGAGC